jgi:uncharacterized membrane protein
VEEFIKLTAEIVNGIHDNIDNTLKSNGHEFTDKELHFWIMGVIGILFFLFSYVLFKWLAEWSITVIAFIYTMTILLVVNFAIEIQQKITKRGYMEFDDIIAGIKGFLFLFIIFLVLKSSFYAVNYLLKKSRNEDKPYKSTRFNKG